MKTHKITITFQSEKRLEDWEINSLIDLLEDRLRFERMEEIECQWEDEDGTR